MPRTEALAWCNRDDYGWCGHHNRPFKHCEAEALDTVAAERERITREATAAACQCIDHASCNGCHDGGDNLRLSALDFLAIVNPEAESPA